MKLTDQQFQEVKDLGRENKIKITGWSVIMGGIALDNNKKLPLWGKNMIQLKKSITK